MAGPLPGRLEGGQTAPKAPFCAGSGGRWKEHYLEHLGPAGEAPLPQDRGLSSSSRALPSGLSRAAQEVPSICPRPAGTGDRSAKHSLPRLFLQVYMFKCVWRCYKFMKYMNSAEERNSSQMPQKVSRGGGGPVPALPLPVSSGACLSPSLGCSFSPCEMMGAEESEDLFRLG